MEGKAEGTRKQRESSIPGPFDFIHLRVHKWQISQLACVLPFPNCIPNLVPEPQRRPPSPLPQLAQESTDTSSLYLTKDRAVADSGVKGAGGSFVKASLRSHLSQTQLLTLTIMPRA